MILIPGAYFVNAIREFTQNNYYSGLALMLSGVSTCLSISVGVLAMISLLPLRNNYQACSQHHLPHGKRS